MIPAKYIFQFKKLKFVKQKIVYDKTKVLYYLQIL